MKKLILTIVLVLSILTIGTVSYAATNTGSKELVQEKIEKDFSTQFASTPTIASANDGYIGTAVIDGHEVSAAYNTKGNRIYSIVRYTPDNLAKDIVDVVKTKYDKYYITSMEKVEAPGFKPVFIVHLTNSNTIKTVRVVGDATELIQNFKKD